jgi:multiple sugar transport system substrate-binding protein
MTIMRLGVTCRRALVVGILGLLGCTENDATATRPPQPHKGVRIVVGAIGDAAILETVSPQRVEWEEKHLAQVTLQVPSTKSAPADAPDVVLFPGDRMGELVDRKELYIIPDAALRPPTPRESEEKKPAEDGDPYAFADVIPAVRDQVIKYGDTCVGLPYGGSALVLVYRRDAFESPANLAAAKEAKIALEPPTTWGELDALAKFFHGRDWNADGTPESGIGLPLDEDPDGLMNAVFLSRAAALGLDRDQFSFLFDSSTLEPRVASPPFIEAMTSLHELRKSALEPHADLKADGARIAFHSGKVALLIDRAERASRWGDPKKPFPIGVAPLPGSHRVYDFDSSAWKTVSSVNRISYLPFGGGWIAGIPASCSGRQREAALDFLKYLTGPEVSSRILGDRAFPMLPTRSSQLSVGLPDPRSAPGVDSRQWGRAVADTFTAARIIPGLRIPEADKYLEELSRARVAVAGGKSPEAALKEVAQAWSERNKKLGQDRQLWHYRRSLNRAVTAPEPPPR